MLNQAEREIIADLYLSRSGLDFLEELIDRFGSRFGGSPEEQEAASFIRERLLAAGAAPVTLETFQCAGWTRKDTRLTVNAPAQQEIGCIALPYCPPGEVTGRLVYLGDGHPQNYADQRENIKDAIVMVTTATPRFYHRSMHRGEKLGRALEAGAAGFIWMRGEAGGLPETGSARFNKPCEVPAISVSYEAGHELVRLSHRQPVELTITSTNENHTVTSHNVVAEFKGAKRPDEIIVLGAHYDGHDISQAAGDNGAGAAVLVEAARGLGRHQKLLERTVRLVAFAQEEMGLIGASHHAHTHAGENIKLMLNLDGAGRGPSGTFQLQGWPESIGFFKDLFKSLYEPDVAVGDQIGLYSDMYPFAALGIPAATYTSSSPGTAGAPRGYGHTAWDSLDKVQSKPIQVDAARIARLTLRLSQADEIPLNRKEPAAIGAILKEMGLDTVLQYERRPIPGEA
ncbi:MAG: M28 family peptidase [Thermaerobacterales bacterium]